MEATEQMAPEANIPAQKLGPTFADKMFLVLLVLVLVGVARVGQLTYREGMKTEGAKENAEVMAKWMAAAAAERFKPDFKPAACAGSAAPVAAGAAAATAVPGTSLPWGACMKELLAPEGPLGTLRNPFTGAVPVIAAKCDPADKSLAGALVLEKSLPAPAGSAVPVIISTLAEADPIDQKMQLRVSACDDGAYPGKPTDFEF